MLENVVGAQLYTLRDFTNDVDSVAKTFKKVKDIGYTAIQVSAMNDIDPKDTARIAEDNGLTIAATHVGWERFQNDLDAVIEEHKLWKCKHAAVGSIAEEYRNSVDGLKKFLDELAPITEKLAAEGMDFSYHNHSFELVKFDGETWLDMLYNQSDPKMLKAEIDTYWIQHGGCDPVEWVRKVAGRMPLLHLKDMAITLDKEQRMAEIGEGNLNWEKIIEAAKETGVEWYLVEQDQCYDRDPFESLAISYKNLKAMGLS